MRCSLLLDSGTEDQKAALDALIALMSKVPADARVRFLDVGPLRTSRNLSKPALSFEPLRLDEFAVPPRVALADLEMRRGHHPEAPPAVRSALPNPELPAFSLMSVPLIREYRSLSLIGMACRDRCGKAGLSVGSADLKRVRESLQGCAASLRMLSITHILTRVETSTVFRFASRSIMRLAASGIRMFNCFVLGCFQYSRSIRSRSSWSRSISMIP